MGLRSKITLSLILPTLIVGYILLSNFTLENKSQSTLFNHGGLEKSITFLLGEDKKGYQYFRLAEEHFLFDEEEKTDLMIKSCRSIEDMIHYLNDHSQDNSWSTIQVVLHGNPWNGLSIPIESEGPRASPKKLVKAIMDNPLPSLKTNAIDSSTKINFWGCGIGKNPFIKIALDSFLVLPTGDTPNIYVSPHFVIFKEVGNGIPAKRIKASYWPYIFKRGYRPSDGLIAQELQNQHPDVPIDWNNAIVNNETHEQEGLFQNSFHLPVSWTVIYPTKKSRPALKTEEDKMNWVRSQEELMRQVDELNIPLDKFNWTVNKIILTQKDGTKVPAIKAIGMATVLCVMEEV